MGAPVRALCRRQGGLLLHAGRRDGNPNFPIWVGCFWGDNQIDSADATPSIKFLRTTALKIRIDDSNSELLIENDSGSSIKLTAMDITYTSKTITQSTSSTKTVLDSVRFDVNSGAFTVM
jgi:hypothetical protein